MRKSLTDILKNGRSDRLRSAWESTDAADEFQPLPSGEYLAMAESGELFTSRQNQTPGYRLTFRVAEGPRAGRKLWFESWLTDAAMPMTTRDVAKLGICSLEQLEQPLPQGIRCRLHVALRRNDDGTEFNHVRRFEVVGIDPPEADAFAPSDTPKPPEPGSAAATSEGGVE